MFASMQCNQQHFKWDSHIRSVHPSPICPFLQVFTACNGKVGFHSKILGKYRKKSLAFVPDPCDQVFYKLQAGLGSVSSAPAPTASSIFYVSIVAAEGKKHPLDSTSMRLIISLDFQLDSSTEHKILTLVFKILLTVLHFN